MIEVASCVGTVKYIRRGISAISYEVALDTNSVTADGKTGKFLTTNLGNFRFIKHVGGDSEEQQDICSTYNYLVMFIGSLGTCILVKKPDGSGGYKYSSSRGNCSISDAMAACNVSEGSIRLVKFMWYDKPIKVDGSYDYIDNLCRNLGVPSDDMQLKILASNTLTVVQNGTDGKPGGPGDRGSSGPVWRQHVGFVSATADAPYQYYAGSNDERFIDVVLIDKVWYRCLQAYKSTGTDDVRNTPANAEFAKYWTSADMAGFTFIATRFLLADNAKINLFGSNEINLYSDNTDGSLFASFRVPSNKDGLEGDRGEYVLWIGAEDPVNASFSVKKTGEFKALEGYIGNFKIEYDDDPTGYKFYRLRANSRYNGYYIFPERDIYIGYNGISTYFGKLSQGLPMARVDIGSVTMEKDGGMQGAFISVNSDNTGGLKTYEMTGINLALHPATGQACTALYANNGDIFLKTGKLIGGSRRPYRYMGSNNLDLNTSGDYVSGMILKCNGSSDASLKLPTAASGAKAGDYFTMIKTGAAKVNVYGESYIPCRGGWKEGNGWTCSTRYEHTHFLFDGHTWYSECTLDT